MENEEFAAVKAESRAWEEGKSVIRFGDDWWAKHESANIHW